MNKSYKVFVQFILIIISFGTSGTLTAQSICPDVPSFTLNFTGHPDSVFYLPNQRRACQICSALDNFDCLLFNITLDKNCQGIKIEIVGGAEPNGTGDIQVSCGTKFHLGDTICTNGVGPHAITMCKPGGNPNTYKISAIRAPSVGPAIAVSNACTGTIYATGYKQSSIRWTSVYPGVKGAYDAWLSCTSNCNTSIVTAKPGYPPYVDYQVSGYPPNACGTKLYLDTVRVFFITDKTADIPRQVICYGGTNATLTANGTGGAPPYKYRWSTGQTTKSISVGVGTYSVEISDTTNCPPVYATTIVTANPSPITANAGPPLKSCSASPAVTLNGSVVMATGGIWSGGAGNFNPNNTTLNAIYTPSAAEIAAGSVTLTLTTTGNMNCSAVTSQVTITISKTPVGSTTTSSPSICSNTATSIGLNSSVLGTTYTWIASASSATISGYSAGSAPYGGSITQTLINSGTTSGNVTYTITPTYNNCAGSPTTFTIIVNPKPDVTATAASPAICNSTATNISLSSLVANVTYSWTASPSSAAITGSSSSSGFVTSTTIAQTLSNSGTTVGSVIYTITPRANNCDGVPKQVTIFVNPIPDVTATAASPAICSSTATNISLSSLVANVTYSWTALPSSAAITGSSSSTGFINTTTIAQTLSNSGTTVGSVIYTITPRANNCDGVPKQVTIFVNPIPDVTATAASPAICSSTATNISLSSLVANVTYSWTALPSSAAITGSSSSTGFINTTTIAQTLSNSGTTVGSVIYTITPRANNCDGVPKQVTIFVNPKPDVTATAASPAICNNTATNISLSSLVANVTYSWTALPSSAAITGSSSSSGFINTTTIAQTLSNSGTTVGSVIYTITPRANNCDGVPKQVTIFVNPKPDVTATAASPAICNSTATNISLSSLVANVTYSWTALPSSAAITGSSSSSGFVTTNNITQTLSNSGTTVGSVIYTITPRANNCDGIPKQVTIFVNPIPDVTATAASPAICNNTATNISLSSLVANVTYSWTALPSSAAITGSSSSSGFINTTTIAQTLSNSGTTVGSVIYTITPRANNCDGVPKQVTIFVNPIPDVTATAASPAICSSTATNISLSSLVANVTYSWTALPSSAAITGSSSSTGFINTTTIAQTLSNSGTTVGSVIYTITPRANNCDGVPKQVTIFVNPKPDVTATAASPAICNNTATNISLSSLVANVTYSWTALPSSAAITGSSSSSGFINTTTIAQTLSNSGTTVGSVIYTITPRANNCDGVPKQVTIFVNPIPDVTATAASPAICSSTATNISLSSLVANVTYSWTALPSSAAITGSSSSTGFINTTTIAQTLSNSGTTVGSVIYTITPRANNCDGVPKQVTIFVNPKPDVTATAASPAICNSTATNISLSSLVANVTYSWTALPSSAAITGSSSSSGFVTTNNITQTLSNSGTTVGSVIYTITPKANGCLGSPTPVTITVYPTPVAISSMSSQTICSNNSINIALSSAVAGTTFTWTASSSLGTGGSGNTIIQTLVNNGSLPQSVTYSITPKANGCDGSPTNVTFIVNPKPNILITDPTPPTICDKETTNIQFNSNVPGTVFTWIASGASYISGYANGSGNSITQTLTNSGNSSGSVNYTIRPTSGSCQGNLFTLAVAVKPSPIISANPFSQAVCSPGITNISLTSSVLGTNFTWTPSGPGSITGFSNGSGNSSATKIAQTLTNNSIVAGTVTYVITSQASSCPGNSLSIPVRVDHVPNANAGLDRSICADVPSTPLNGNIISASGGRWNSSGSGTFGNVDSLRTTYTPSANDKISSPVSLILTSTGNGSCPAKKDTMLLTIYKNTIISKAGNDTTICSNTLQLSGKIINATGGNWTSTGSGSFVPNPADLKAVYHFSNADRTAGSVALILTSVGNVDCNAKSDTMYVTVRDRIVVNTSAIDTTCSNGNAIPLDGVASTGDGIWSSLGTGTFNPDANGLITSYIPSANEIATGKVTLILTSDKNQGCVAVKDTSITFLVPGPKSNFTSDSVCLNQLSLFTSTKTGIGTIVSRHWEFGDGDTATVQNPSHLYPSAGNYIVRLVVKTNTGCIESITKEVTVNPLPIANFSSNANCFVDSVFFTNNSSISSGSLSWNWNFGDTFSSMVQNPTHVYVSPGNYQIMLKVMSDDGCGDTIIQNLSVQPTPIAIFNNTLSCSNGQTFFTDASTILYGSVNSWKWNFGDGSPVDSLQNPSHIFSGSGSQNVSLIVGSANGCVDTLLQTINVNDKPHANFMADGVCLNEGTLFTDASTVNGATITSWNWNFGKNVVDSLQNPPIHYYKVSGNYSSTLIVISSLGCKDTVVKSYVVLPGPKTGFIADNYTPDVKQPVNFTDTTKTSISRFWNFGDGSDDSVSTDQRPQHIYHATGYYNVCLITSDINGCRDTICQTVIVTLPPSVPSAFSPNADGQNDFLYVYGGPFKTMDLKIYNNWGEVIFESDRQSIGWDGKRKGIDQPIGVYVYILTCVSENGKFYKLSGDVTLIR